ncbi:hypothetical protein ACE193_21660 [Bernardetia sp. OM2101]|uniref:hypothetical protein n=1 Tax=Bernardetia sp. OM2101 TaxID=3344876 RepID=UPI0035CEC77E
MAEQNESIEELKDVVSFACDAGEALARIREDGKTEKEEVTKEGFGLLMKSTKLVGIAQAIEQRKHLQNPAKRQELVDFFKKDFDIENDEVEEFVEEALEALDKLVGVGQKGMNLRKKKEA